MALEKTFYDFSLSGVPGVSGNIALVSGTSATSGTLPVGIELLMVVVSNACHFRIGVGAQTAVVTDPMINPGSAGTVIKLADPSLAYTLAVIPDNNANLGNVNYFRVYEG